MSDLLTRTVEDGSLTLRQRGILVCACASTMGDAYCSLAWGKKLADEAGSTVAAGVLRGDDRLLDPAEQALARWARQVTRAPNDTDATDVQALLDAGYDKRQILAITVYAALRVAFSTVNDALGALPDAALGRTVPEQVRAAVTFGGRWLSTADNRRARPSPSAAAGCGRGRGGRRARSGRSQSARQP